MSGSTSLEARPASLMLEQLVMEDLKTEETSPMEQLRQGHRLQSMAKSKKLTGAIKDLGDQISSSLDVSSAFSSCLEEVCFSPFCIFFFFKEKRNSSFGLGLA
uniref:Uncharacterized protein n=1 Tax=Noccaea caerulescens TaxID=107243 RepID=A0A1J3G6P7_NOCCA